MYNLIENICITNNWSFNYARKDFANLYNGDEQVGDENPIMFLDPIVITETFGDYNEVISTNYTGSFMLVKSSHIDEEDYNTRYQKYIKPVIDESLKIIKDTIRCDGEFSIAVWRSTEVINMLDFNGDGVVINYSINGQ